MKSLNDQSRGFTLLELLIVIAIIAIIAAILIWVLNPAETLRKGRDSQRMSDLKTLNQTLGLYITDLAISGKSVDLDGPTSGWCNRSSLPPSGCYIAYSGDGNPTTDDITSNTNRVWGNNCSGAAVHGVTAEDSSAIDGSGWIPINFNQISSNSPIARLPLDPNFSVETSDNPTENDLLYVYICGGVPSLGFELNTNLESEEFRNGGRNDKESTDGGDNPNTYEIGTNLRYLQSL